jgi:hypothetical protein
MEVPAHQLIGLRDMNDLEDGLDPAERRIVHAALVADDADGRPLRSRDSDGLESHGSDRFFDKGQILVRGPLVHYDKHEELPIFRSRLSIKQKAGFQRKSISRKAQTSKDLKKLRS